MTSRVEGAGTSGLDRVRRRLRSVQLSVVVVLTVVWVLLWGELSIGNVVGGVLVAAVVCVVFPLPPLRMQLTVRPWRLVVLLVRFASDVVVASVQVAATVLRPRPPRNAVIEVDLRTRSDFVLTVVAELLSLVPGSLVVEARRSTHTLFVHVLDAGDATGVERMRRDVFDLERRVVLALGAQTEHLDGRPAPVAEGEAP